MLTAPTVEEKLKLVPLMVFPLAYCIFIYIVSYNCSRVVTKNVQIHRQIRKFNITFSGDVSTVQRFKMETFDCYQRFFQKTAFKTCNNYTIDFRLFELLASFCVYLALKIYKRQFKTYF